MKILQSKNTNHDILKWQTSKSAEKIFGTGKRFFPYILIIIIVFGIFVPTSTVHAQVATAIGGAVSAALNAVLSNLSGYIISPLLYLVQKIIALFMGLSGMILNKVLEETVVNMRDHISLMTGINVTWKVLRDLMNIAFIFMLVYQGILMIIGVGSIDRVRKFIVGIVLAALLINFSLFFTKVFIDASNIVTIGIYNSILNQTPATGLVPGGLSDAMQQSLGLQGFFSAQTIQLGTGGGDYGQLIANLMSSILFLITTFVFLAVSVLFVIRYIVLILLLAFSPIAYMGLAGIPGIKQMSNDWWESLWGQLLFAPIFMLMIWVVLTIIRSPGFFGAQLNPQDWATLTQTQSGASIGASVGLLLNFAIVIGLTLASLITAKKFSSKGASQIRTLSAGATAFAGGAIFGGTARLSRATIGRAGNAMANDEELKKKASEGNVRARIQLAAANRAASSSFDARATGGFKSIGAATGTKFGEVNVRKENFRAEMDQRAKDAEEKAKRYRPTDLAVIQAKSKLDEKTDEGKGFIDEENARKRAKDIYMNSDDYKNSEEFKKIQKTEDDNRRDKIKVRNDDIDVKNSQQRLDNLRHEMDTYADNTPQKVQIKESIETLKNETERKQSLLRDLKSLVESREKFLKESEFDINTWMSDEKKNLIATAGGTKEDKGKIKDAAGNIVSSHIKSAYEQRIEAEASRIENKSRLARYTANTLGTITNAVGMTSTSMTRTDRQEMARRLRKLPQGKKKPTVKEFKEVYGIEMADAEETPETGGGNTTAVTTPQEPAPPASPPPPTT